MNCVHLTETHNGKTPFPYDTLDLAMTLNYLEEQAAFKSEKQEYLENFDEIDQNILSDDAYKEDEI